VVGLIFFWGACSQKQEKQTLSASIFPIKWVLEKVYNNYQIYQIIKPGNNPHLYELTPKDIIQIKKSKKVFLIGNLEPFSQRIDAQKKIEIIKLLKIRENENPHIWLSPKKWLKFVKKLPSIKELSLNRTAWKEVIKKLTQLDKKYSSLPQYKVIMIHPAYYWLCKDYGLTIYFVLEPNIGELSLKRISLLIGKLKEEKSLRDIVVFYSSIDNKEKEIYLKLKKIFPNLKGVALNPLIWETSGDYIKLMEENLHRIKKAGKLVPGGT